MIALLWILAGFAVILAGWALGAAQAAYRLARESRSRINVLEGKIIVLEKEEEESKNNLIWLCSACTRDINEDDAVEVQIDLPMNPESTVLLPVTIELCKECASLGTSS